MKKILLLVIMFIFASIASVHAEYLYDELTDLTNVTDCSSNIALRNGYIKSLGDDSVINCNASAGANEYIRYSVDRGEELIVTTYRFYTETDSFKFYFITASGRSAAIKPTVSYNTVCADDYQYYRTVYRFSSPAAGFIEIRFPTMNSSNHWKYLIGNVTRRDINNENRSVHDEFIDYTHIYSASYHINECKSKYLERKTAKTISGSATEQFYPYSPAQYVIYRYTVSENKEALIQIATDKSTKYEAGQYDFVIETSKDLVTWKSISCEKKTTGSTDDIISEELTCYDSEAGTKYIRISWTDDMTLLWAPTIKSVVISDNVIETTKLKSLKYYQNGTRITVKPASYSGRIAVTGDIENANATIGIEPELFLAMYDEEGRLTAVSSRELYYVAPKSAVGFMVECTVDNASSIKLFVLDDMTPLSYSVEALANMYTEAAGGTLTDPLADTAYMYDAGRSLRFVSTMGSAITSADDRNRICRRYPISESFKYHIRDMKAATLTVYTYTRKEECIKVYGSWYDGGYTELEMSSSEGTYTSGGWYKYTYTVNAMPENTDFIKIVMVPDFDPEWSVEVGEVSITY